TQKPSLTGRKLALRIAHMSSSRYGNDPKKLMTKTSILKYLSILHTLTLPGDEACTPHDFNHNKGSR
ncbi:hypothetical protein, partial [Pseudomonas sp. P5_A2_2]